MTPSLDASWRGLLAFVFYYPLFMSFLWMLGAALYYWRFERADADGDPGAGQRATPPVSVLIPSHNEGENVAETVAIATPGTYVGYNQNNIFDPSRGTYRFSHYYFLRYGTGTTWQTGAQPALLVSEMDLLKAEGLIRLGRAAEAVPLITKTRNKAGTAVISFRRRRLIHLALA